MNWIGVSISLEQEAFPCNIDAAGIQENAFVRSRMNSNRIVFALSSGGRSAAALGRRHNVTSGWEVVPETRFILVPSAQLIRQRISVCDDAR
jgi:hypothetical protein